MVKRWALLCGGDWYAPGTARPRRPTNLKGCVRDAEDMRDLLLEFQDPNLSIRMLTASSNGDADQPLEPADRWPTWENINRELRSIEDEANADEGNHDRLLYFHYSGHGTMRSNVPSFPIEYDDEDDVLDLEGTALVMTDVTSGGAYLSGRQLGFWIRRMVKGSGFRVTIVLDSCYSGHGLRNDDDDNGTPRTLDYIDHTRIDVDNIPEEDVDEDDLESSAELSRDASAVDMCWLSNPTGCTVITACSKQKKASEKIFDATAQGVLTYWLRRLLSRHRVTPQLWPSHKRVVDYVRSNSRPAQMPMVFGDDLHQFFGLKSYAEAESCNATRKSGDLVKLDVGEAQGVVAGAVYDVAPTGGWTTDKPPPYPQVRVTSRVEAFESWAELVDEASLESWPQNETRAANLHQWALPTEVRIHIDPGTNVDSSILRDELAARPGLVLGHGSPSGRDFVISLDRDNTFVIRQDGKLLPRLPTISKITSAWSAELVRVLSHVSRFQALQDLYQSLPNHSRLPQTDFELVSRPEQVVDGEQVNLKLTYNRPMSSLWVSLYCFSASWGIKKLWPPSGIAAEEADESELFDENITMTIPSKWRNSDPDAIEDQFFLFVSTSGATQIPSWGNICLPSLRPTELTAPLEWTRAGTAREGDDRDGSISRSKAKDTSEKARDWTVLKKAVVTKGRAIPHTAARPLGTQGVKDGDDRLNVDVFKLSVSTTAEPVTTEVESVPSLTESSVLRRIENTISRVAVGADGQNQPRHQATVQVSWMLRTCLQTELDNNADLSSFLTITGDADHSWATSCEQYVCEVWKEFGKTLLESLNSVLEKVVKHQKLGETVTVSENSFPNLSLSLPPIEAEHNLPATITFEGTSSEISTGLQFFAWIAATFRPPKSHELSFSTVQFDELPGDFKFSLILAELRSFNGPERGTCWKALFPSTVMAYGFPAVSHPEFFGLRIPVQTMFELAGILSDTTLEDEAGNDHGVYFESDLWTLYPTAYIEEDNLVQWHITKRVIQKESDPGVASEKDWPQGLLRTINTETMADARAILGYCQQVDVQLGTASRVDQYEDYLCSGATTEPGRAEASVGAVSLTASILGRLMIASTVNIKYRRGLVDAVKDQETAMYSLILESAAAQPVILFDTKPEMERAWMVPELSLVLDLFNFWVFYRRKENGGLAIKVPYASAGPDGGLMAKAVLSRPEYADQVAIKGYKGEKDFLVSDMIKRIYWNVESRRFKNADTDEGARGTMLLGRTPITGWDWLDLIPGFSTNLSVRRNVRPRFHWFQKAPKPIWLGLTDKIPLFLGQDIGKALEPAQPGIVCALWNPLPGGIELGYLAASMRCVESLSRKCGTTRDICVLFHGQVWEFKDPYLFEPCGSCTQDKTQCTKEPQALIRQRTEDMLPVPPPDEAWRDGAIIFGEHTRG